MKLLPYTILLLIAGLLLGTFLRSNAPEPAGDIVEYYGITESLIRHSSIALSPLDQSNISTILHPVYFSNPGYYMQGVDKNRYPVHFIVYSLFLIPIRLILEFAQLNPLLIFSIGNCIMLFTALFYIMRYTLESTWQRMVLLIATVLSPLISFLWWPGPDIFSMSLLLVALFIFYKDKPLIAAILTDIASWQSQPLIVVSLGMFGYWIWTTQVHSKKIRWVDLVKETAVITTICVVPYIYNYLAFGTWTPWTILQDYWTQTYGFGLQNISLHKLFEQFFDLNIGVFWYAPMLTVLGLLALRNNMWVAAVLVATLFAYQTNPAWHYGTAGFGPSRHALVLIPFFIAAIVWHVKQEKRWTAILILLVISQLFILSLNNYIFPVFSNSLEHSPIAKLFLNTLPALYNPTPEIFVDRTNHTDLDHPSSAIYMNDGICKKAYVLVADIDRVTQTCGSLGSVMPATILHPDRDGFYINYE